MNPIMEAGARLPATMIAVALAAGACGGGAIAQSAMPNGGHDTSTLTKCTVAASHEQPLVTEWPAPYKARLEALLHEGAVAVEYSGCELRIVDECKIPGEYAWNKTTLSTDTTDIRDEDELYAKLPLGAAALSGELKTSGSLHVQTTVSGQMRLVGDAAHDATSGAECSRATHLVTALSVGAFKLVASGDASGKVGASVGGLGVEGAGKESQTLVRAAGDPASCEQATKDEPSVECDSPIQIFLTPIRRSVPLHVLSPLPSEQ
jgi:hypothetical protein